jgi:hypothetical protein
MLFLWITCDEMRDDEMGETGMTTVAWGRLRIKCEALQER